MQEKKDYRYNKDERYYREESYPEKRGQAKYYENQGRMEESVFGISRHTAYVIFIWAFRLISLFFIFLLWKLVLAPFVPVVKPLFESLFITQSAPLNYMGGKLYIGGVSVFDLRELIILSVLRFAVLTFGLTIVRLVKRLVYKALFM